MSFAETGQQLNRFGGRGVALANLNGDGCLNAFVVNVNAQDGEGNRVYFGDCHAGAAPTAVPSRSPASNCLEGRGVALADLNGDARLNGKGDLVRILSRSIGIMLLLLAVPALPAQGDYPAGRAFQRELLRELVEIDSTAAFGSTKAAEAMAARLRTGGFPESDMILAGPSADKRNLVVRLRGKGNGKPILLIGHLDVVDAPKEGWAAGLDPFRQTERDCGTATSRSRRYSMARSFSRSENSEWEEHRKHRNAGVLGGERSACRDAHQR